MTCGCLSTYQFPAMVPQYNNAQSVQVIVKRENQILMLKYLPGGAEIKVKQSTGLIFF